MTTVEMAKFRECVTGALEAIGQTIQLNGWDPRPGSQGAAEMEAQAPFVRRSKAPVADTFSHASLRLGSANEHLSALNRLLDDPPSGYASATVARAVLENSARAAWSLDPALDVRMRVARGRTDTIMNLIEVSLYPFPRVQEQVKATLAELLEDTEAIGLHPLRNKKGRFLGVEEESPGPTRTIREAFDEWGTIIYRDLSAVAHGGATSLLDRMTPVEDRPGSTLMKPADPTKHIPSFAGVLNAFGSANTLRFRLFGWDAQPWVAWIRTTAATMRELLPQDLPGEER